MFAVESIDEAKALAASDPVIVNGEMVAEYHAWLVPDVVSRLRRVLEPAFDVTVSDGGRCGPMLRASRR